MDVPRLEVQEFRDPVGVGGVNGLRSGCEYRITFPDGAGWTVRVYADASKVAVLRGTRSAPLTRDQSDALLRLLRHELRVHTLLVPKPSGEWQRFSLSRSRAFTRLLKGVLAFLFTVAAVISLGRLVASIDEHLIEVAGIVALLGASVAVLLVIDRFGGRR
jgi:hypothetical protein